MTSIRATNSVTLDRAVGFDEMGWLYELTRKKPKTDMPESMGARLMTRGLIERKDGAFALTARGRIALAKLG
jgi:hypothetical protein